ncbi:MAG: small ribosomal subunit Rsm22 family protein [Chloroflexota bacterium]
MISLPAHLEAAIAVALRAMPSSQWIRAAQQLSERYRADRTDAGAVLATGPKEALGYAALVMPAAYAQLAGAIAATVARTPPDFQPATLLDLGSGPGTALWAAVEQWSTLRSLHAWEREPAFINLGRQLAAAGDNDALKQAEWRQITLSGPLPRQTGQYDVVIIGHVLNELDDAARRVVVESAWEHCAGLLLIVEPGTSAAFPIVRAAREHLLALGAHTLAPCVHDLPCPLQNDWCHFPQRLNRPDFQRRAKEASAGWEEAKFSYAAMARFPAVMPAWGRLIHQPQVNKAGVELIVSSQRGIVRPRIPRRNRPRYRWATNLKWGGVLEEAVEDGA